MVCNAEDHLKLVHKIANRYNKGNRMEYDDIFQEGCVGLIRAIEEYKEGEIPFGTFAGMHIQFSILTALRKSNVFRINPETIWLASKINKQGLIDTPVVEIAQTLNTEERFVKRALEYLNIDVLSLDFEYGDSEDKSTLLDRFRHEISYEDEIYIEQMFDVYEVPERDKRILRLVLDGYTLADAARELGEDVRATGQRKLMRKRRLQKKKHLIYA